MLPISVLYFEIDIVRYKREFAKSFAMKLFVFGALLKREKSFKVQNFAEIQKIIIF